MTMRIECDACKKIYERLQDTFITSEMYTLGVKAEYHLCPDCSLFIRNVIENRNSNLIVDLEKTDVSMWNFQVYNNEK